MGCVTRLWPPSRAKLLAKHFWLVPSKETYHVMKKCPERSTYTGTAMSNLKVHWKLLRVELWVPCLYPDCRVLCRFICRVIGTVSFFLSKRHKIIYAPNLPTHSQNRAKYTVWQVNLSFHMVFPEVGVSLQLPYLSANQNTLIRSAGSGLRCRGAGGPSLTLAEVGHNPKMTPSF